jgi:hypothetical protein
MHEKSHLGGKVRIDFGDARGLENTFVHFHPPFAL